MKFMFSTRSIGDWEEFSLVITRISDDTKLFQMPKTRTDSEEL